MRIFALILALMASSLFLKAADIQVPFDSKGDILTLQSAINNKFGIFPDQKDFVEAKIYQISDSAYSLEIIHKTGSRYVRLTQILSNSGYTALVQKFDALLKAETNAPVKLNQEGRIYLITSSTIISLAFYGAAVPSSLDVNNGTTALTLYMATAASGILIPYFITDKARVSIGDAAMTSAGQYVGIMHGAALPYLFQKDPHYTTNMASMLLFSIAEGIAGYQISRNFNFYDGKGLLIRNANFLGAGWGTMLSGGLDLFEQGKYREFLSLALISSIAFDVAAANMADNQYLTSGDVDMITTPFVLGAMAGASAGLVANSNDFRPMFYGASLMSLAGGALGYYLTEGYDFSSFDGSITELATLGGSLLGAGIGYLISTSDANKPGMMIFRDALICSTIAGIGTYSICYNSFGKDSKADKGFKGSLDYFINPMALMNKNPNYSVPMAGFSYKF